MSDIITFISSVGGSALLSAGLVFLAKSWISERLKNAIKHEYDEKLETHRAQLRRECDKEIEELKAQLHIAAAERSIRLSRVFEKTAETIATTYAKLLAFQDAVKDYTQPLEPSDDPQRSELARNVQSKSADFLQYYLPHKIYLHKETAEKIRVFSNTLHSLVRKFAMTLAVERAQMRNPDTIGNLHKQFEELYEQLPVLLTLLEEDFQRILGLETGDQKLTGDRKMQSPKSQ